MFHILDENGVPTEATSEEYSRWSKDFENRRVDYTEYGSLRVSTVFLGVDHGFGVGKSLWFETMVFVSPSGWSEVYCDRYETIEEAREGHQHAVREYLTAGDTTSAYLLNVVYIAHI